MSIVTKEELEAKNLRIKELPLELFQHIICRYHFYAEKNNFEGISINQWLDLCSLLSSIDKEELFFHVEYPSEDNKMPFPRVWKVHSWRESYEKWIKERKRAEEQRQMRFFQEKKLEELTAAVERDTGLEYELALMVARGIMVTQDQGIREKKAVQFGVSLKQETPK
mgnify:CR=1 FL=1